jgi:Flp pilus assembly secretin CpaC
MRPSISRAFFPAVAACLLALPAAALAMIVPINHAQRIDVQGAAASVVIGNPKIASVTVVDTHTLYVMGRGPGSTNVVVLDKAGHALFTGDVTVAATGSNVSLYRGDKRVQVNCSYGCVEESQGDTQASVGMRGAGAMGAIPNATGAASTMP